MKLHLQKKKKVKAWAIIEDKELASFWDGGNLAYEVWYSKKSATKVAQAYNSRICKYNVVPVEITYTPPPLGK